ncbi:MAG: uncharacterized protein KVP18_004397 [Porospora cf. gigantea A]|uniref:uncharacterized protein n=1 Tax=Porospora cf. gigantea A TaxID=2853593 RepID=UPI0035599F73|nr:MAG: hypothetical protein KVP18_004397 [Porospora cf. gigantea A]
MSLRLCGRCEELSDELAGAHTMRERDRSFNASPETKKERRRDFNEILLAEYRVAQEDPNDSRQRRVSRLEERQARAVQRDRERQSERAQRQLQRLRKAESRELRRIARSTLVSRPMFESTFDASPFSSSLCRDGGLPDDVFFIPTVAMSRRYSVLSAISSGSVPRPTISVREESPSPPVVAIQMAPSAADPSIDIEDCFSAASVKSDAKTSAHQSTSPRVEALSTECVTVQIAEPIPQEHVPAAIPIEPAALPLPIPSRDRAASSLSRRRGSPSRDRAASSLSPRRGGLRKSILSCPKRESTHFTRPLRQNRTRREPKPAPQAKRPDAAEVRELKQSLNDHPVVRYINQSDIVTRNRVLTVQERQDEVRRHCELVSD